ncbi:MAG: YHS domain-containing protein [candidate division Zixibacteria bacterium]|nr:YHS domain-containing protein [candidate division Zixibacteria bacterium]
MTIDPSCKMKVDEKKVAIQSEYQGVAYYFCSPVCKQRFDKEPEKYLKEKK